MKNLFGLVQDSNPAAILQMMKTADTLHMPKILACCERHVAIDAAKTMRTKAFWEQLPACSSVRIVRGRMLPMKFTKLKLPPKYGYGLQTVLTAVVIITVMVSAHTWMTRMSWSTTVS